MKYEVEQKFHVDDLQAVENQLRERGATTKANLVQVDRYFQHPCRDFGQTDEALRIRHVESDGGQSVNLVTYKGPKIDAETKTRRELEFPLQQGDSGAADMAELLQALGFEPVAVVRKQRQTLLLSWADTDVEAALDNVDQLGTFVEFELAAEDDTLESAKQRLLALAKELRLSDPERSSYLELLLAKQPASSNGAS